MLHVQEPFHNSSLLMQPPVTVIVVQPSSSRSTKVIEQQSTKYELIQKEIAATKAQLELVQQTKSKYEKDYANQVHANQVNRARIKDIMKIIEEKQQQLEGTKQSSIQLERLVKQLKETVLSSRLQSEDLRRREQVLERNRNAAVKETNQMKHKQQLLYSSIEQFRVRCDREIALLRKDLSLLVDQTAYVTERSSLFAELVHLKLKQRRHTLLTHDDTAARHSQHAPFIEYVQTTLQTLTADMGSKNKEDALFAATVSCQGDVVALVSKIKATTFE